MYNVLTRGIVAEIEALRQECETLRASYRYAEDHAARLMSERDEMRAEISRMREGYDGGRAADELERLLAVLERIGAMDPATDSIEGYNEWGEADCFRQAQSAALMALGPNVKWTGQPRRLHLAHCSPANVSTLAAFHS